MQAFDDLLRQGLMEANLIEYTSELDNLPGWNPDFSPKYRRGRKRLLANPRTWMRRRAQPVWKRVGRTADRYEGAFSDELVWEAADGTLLYVSAPDGSALLEQAAESAAPWTGTPAEYEVGWALEGYTDPAALFSSGVGTWYWVRNHTLLELYYVNDPICPFRVPPGRMPEEVTVNGLPGLFWPSIFSREEWDARVAEECSDDPNSFMNWDTEEAAVLTWEDPETNTAFRISGIAEKEELLRTAESVTRKSP